MKYFPIHYLHGLNKWDYDHVAQRSHNIQLALLKNFQTSSKPLSLAYGAKYKISQTVPISTCLLSLMHWKYLPKIFIHNISAIYSSRIRALSLNSW